MLRPERMSRVSVTGSKRVMDDVIDAVHGMRLLHVTEYDGSWEGFEPGDPVAGADEAAERLVTVRSLRSILDVDPEDANPTTQVVTEAALDEQLEEVRQEVNALDDRRGEIRDRMRETEERIATMEPFVTLGVDLDLLQGYDSVSVRVGEGDPEAVTEALSDAPVGAFEVFAENGVVAAVADCEEAALVDALIDVQFAALEVPDGEGSPDEYLVELHHRRDELEEQLDEVDAELAELREEVGPFLLAAEEELTITVEKQEAPLDFATTENAFIAEGWIPTTEYDTFVTTLHDAVGEHVEIQELERADYDGEGQVTDREETPQPGEPGQPTAADGGVTSEASSEARSDGGTVTTGPDEPPVVQKNPGPVKPFEALVQVIERPKYSEFDPSVVLFLTFPAFFGFMIGDLGYGLLYMGIGALLYTRFDSDVIRSLGGVAMWAGGFTALFGVFYGEIFGLHTIADVVWGGSAPMHKGLQPVDLKYAQAWLVLSLVAGLLHLFAGYLLGFLKELRHGIQAAVTEKASWVLMMGGIWAFIFSTLFAGKKPSFLFAAFGAEGATNPASGAAITKEAVAYPLGFTGLPDTVGLVGLGLLAVGLLLLIVGEGAVGLLESLNVLVNVLSYTRLAAVLLAKAGMAFVVNLLFFGAYQHDGEFHFLLGETPDAITAEFGAEALMFPGMVNLGIAGLLAGVVILLVGHLLVLALGVTSAGLQAVRLEYVEFFGKFYDGGGKRYRPVGRERQYTSD